VVARETDDTRLLRMVRIIASATATFLVAFTVLIDGLGRLFIDPQFHVSEVLFGSLMAGWLALVGIEGFALLRRTSQNEDDDAK
jgi:ABC-type proline/glycine betaine transport system permease subunit